MMIKDQQLRLADINSGKQTIHSVPKSTYYLPVCEYHLINASFTLELVTSIDGETDLV